MDRKKQRHFRGAHPKRYQADVESIVTSVRSRSMHPANNAARQQQPFDKQSHAGRSEASHLSTSQRLKAMSTRASDRLVEAHKNSNMGTTTQQQIR